MDKSQHETAIAAVERTIEASRALRAGLVAGEAIGRKVIEELESGTPVSCAAARAGADPSDLRQGVHDLLATYQKRRHEMRLAFIAPALDEGLTVADISRTLGVSRQLIARLAKEARGEK